MRNGQYSQFVAAECFCFYCLSFTPHVFFCALIYGPLELSCMIVFPAYCPASFLLQDSWLSFKGGH